MKNILKKIPFASILVLIFLVAVVWVGQSRPDGSTTESRQEILNELAKDKSTIEIIRELEIDEHIISAYIRSNEQHGLAIFEPRGKGKYRLKTGVNRPQDAIVMGYVGIGEANYNLFWANKEDLDYAQITYTVQGKTSEPIKLDASDNQILYHESPSGDHSVEAVFFDKQGNKYE